MKQILSPLGLKIILFLLLILTSVGFFYFESSIVIRILVVFLGLIGLLQIRRFPEFLILVDLYLSLYVCYNLRYVLAVPMSAVLVVVAIIAIFFFFADSKLKADWNLSKELLWAYLLIIALALVEVFLAMSFWPTEPKTKTLTNVVVFYCLSRIVYFRVNNMLSLKRISTILAVASVSLLILFGLSYWRGF